MEGKEIGKANGFRLVQLQERAYGSILKVGGREVLVSRFAFLNKSFGLTIAFYYRSKIQLLILLF